MKHFYTVPLAVLFNVVCLQTHAQCTTCTFTVENSSQKSFTLSSGQTLCIKKNFKGAITSFPAGATICVAPGVSFEPSELTNAAGTLNVYGAFAFANLTPVEGFTLNNSGTTSINNLIANGAITLNNTGTANISNIILPGRSVVTNSGTLQVSNLTGNGAVAFTNSSQATLTNITVAAGSAINNTSTLTANNLVFNGAGKFENNGTAGFANITLNSGTTVKNHGLINVSSNLVANTGSAIENVAGAKMYVQNNFTADGDITNQGYARFQGNVVFNASASLTNSCSFVASGNIVNNSNNFKNLGSFVMLSPGTSFTNQGTFYNGSAGFVQGINFHNYNTVTGGGYFRFTETTTNRNNLGVDNDGLTITFYDATPISDRILDASFGTIGAVVRSAVAARDTVSLINNCSATQTILPVKLLSFSGQVVNGKVQLTWQVADNETGDYFEVQQCIDGATFQTKGLLFTTEETNTATYRFSMAPAGQASHYRLKIVNKDNSVSYSKVISFKNQAAADRIVLLQNPVRSHLRFVLPTATAGVIAIRIYNQSGVVVHAEKRSGQQDNTSFSLALQPNLPGGVYILEVMNGKGRATATFLKQ